MELENRVVLLSHFMSLFCFYSAPTGVSKNAWTNFRSDFLTPKQGEKKLYQYRCANSFRGTVGKCDFGSKNMVYVRGGCGTFLVDVCGMYLRRTKSQYKD